MSLPEPPLDPDLLHAASVHHTPTIDDLPIDPDVADVAEAPPPESTRIWDIALVVAAGGAIGGGLRYSVGQVVPNGSAGFPWPTFIENILGSFLLGVLLVMVLIAWPGSRYRRPFIGTGILGGFTTFSAFSVETADLLRTGSPGMAGVYLANSLGFGILAAAGGIILGVRLGRWVDRRRG